MGYSNTETVKATATDGSEVTLVVPADGLDVLDDQVARYDTLFFERTTFLDDHRKGRVEATVPAEEADEVVKAMEWWGAIVDMRVRLPDGNVRLYSEGYWAHGF